MVAAAGVEAVAMAVVVEVAVVAAVSVQWAASATWWSVRSTSSSTTSPAAAPTSARALSVAATRATLILLHRMPAEKWTRCHRDGGAEEASRLREAGRAMLTIQTAPHLCQA